MKLASFDIFDTCLIRKCGESCNVFWLLSKRLYPSNSAKQECYLHWRLEAEEIAIQTTNDDFVTIDDIYNTFPCERFGIISSENLKNAEIALEEELLVVNKEIKDLINSKRQDGYSIAFISDMYLGEEFLKCVLIKFGVFQNGDKLYVSCEKKASKIKSDLYRLVKSDLNPSIWEHYGDNKTSDYAIAKRLGIKSTLVNYWWSKPEKAILQANKENINKYEISILVGFLRYARLCNDSKKAGYSILSADFVVPIYTAYIIDILTKAKEEHIERLYFLARDGWILKQIADMFSDLYKNIDNRYLYVSRKSMYLPSLDSVSKEAIASYWGDELRFITIQQVMSYFKLDKLFKIEELPFNCKCCFKDPNIIKLFFDWINQDCIKTKILGKASDEKKLIEEYFTQEGIYDDINYAMVDVGWKGSGMEAFNKIVNRKVRSFYWGTFSHYRNKYSGIFNTYNYNMRLPLFMITLVEDYFSASPQFSTIGYSRKDSVEPVFDESSAICNKQTITANISAMKLFVECIKKYSFINGKLLNDLSEQLIQILINEPSNMDYTPLSEINCFSEQGNKVGMIHKLSMKHIVKYINGKSIDEIWPEACLYYSYPHVANCIVNIKKCITKIKRFIH